MPYNNSTLKFCITHIDSSKSNFPSNFNCKSFVIWASARSPSMLSKLCGATGPTSVIYVYHCGVIGLGITITRTTFETPKYPRRPRDQYTAQIVNTLELSGPHQIEFKKKPLQLGEVSNNKYMYICSKKCSHCETVALWNSLGTCKTSSIPMRCHWKPNCQRRSSLSLVTVFSVDTARLPCAFAPIFMVRSYF